MITVNGKTATCLYDTWCGYDAIVSEARIRPCDLTGEHIDIRGPSLSAPTQRFPVARIQIKSPYVHGCIKAAVMKDLAFDVILGCKYVFLSDLWYPATRTS